MSKLYVKDKMPNFVFNTAYESDKQLHEVLSGKTVFWVIRYIGCTDCRYDVHLLANNYEKIKAKGAQVFVVMQSDQQHVQEDLKEFKLPFGVFILSNLLNIFVVLYSTLWYDVCKG